MADQGLTVNEEQLVLFKETMQLQRDELAEQAKRNRADEAIETRRITADVEVHTKNLEHAGKVLSAQATDRD
jgi:prophage tail gpP-like protein